MTQIKAKKKSFLHKILVFISIVFAVLLALAFLIPFIEPKVLKSLAAYSLFTPFIIFINVVFLIYWLVTFKRYFIFPLVLFVLGYPNLVRLYKISGEKILQSDDVKIMSYNVRMFNKYEWSDDREIPQKIGQLIKEKAPDILCFQDYAKSDATGLDYPYVFEKFKTEKSQFGHAIYSRFPIIAQGSFDFEKTANNIIWADIIIDSDTIRVYNVHLQSVKLNPKKEYFGEKDAEQLQIRISSAFQIQQEQVEKLIQHQSMVTYPIIIAGDFNNTAFSWVYRQMLKGKKDSFAKAGTGFDRTYDFEIPMRIDYILVDKRLKVNYFKTYKEKYSDHFPILTRIDKQSFKSSK